VIAKGGDGYLYDPAEGEIIGYIIPEDSASGGPMSAGERLIGEGEIQWK